MRKKELESQVDALSIRVAELENQRTNHKVMNQPAEISDEEFNKISAHDMSKKLRRWIEAHYKDPDLCPGAVERMFNTPIEKYNRYMKIHGRSYIRNAQMQRDKEKIEMMDVTPLEAVPRDDDKVDMLIDRVVVNIDVKKVSEFEKLLEEINAYVKNSDTEKYTSGTLKKAPEVTEEALSEHLRIAERQMKTDKERLFTQQADLDTDV